MSAFPSDVRIVAIAASATDALRIIAAASTLPHIPVALMLRDAEHRLQRVREMGERVTSRSIPFNVHLAGNGLLITSATFIHLPFSMGGGIPLSSYPVPAGMSVHTINEAEAARASGPAYLIASPVFPTESKKGHPGIGLDALRTLVTESPVPVYALGGVNRDNAEAVMETGAHGIASISLFVGRSREVANRLQFIHRIVGRFDSLPENGRHIDAKGRRA